MKNKRAQRNGRPERPAVEGKSQEDNVADIEVSDGGTVYLITALNSGALIFLEEHLAEDAIRFGSAYAVEYRYIMPLVISLRQEGWSVR